MEYQVWTHDDYEGWKKVDCGDLVAAQREVMGAITTGKQPLLTVSVPYDFSIKIKEDRIGEATKGKAGGDKGPGAESKGKVRSGADDSVQELDQRDRDSSSGDSVPGK